MIPMDGDYIEKHDIAQQYRTGKLSQEEAEAFEIYLMDHPELLEQLELDSVFAEHFPNIEQNAASRSTIFDWLFRPGLQFATVAVVAFLVGFWVQTPVQQNEGLLATSGNIDIQYVSHLRSAGQEADAEFALSELAQTVLIVVQPYLSEHNDFDVQVMDRKGQTLFTQSALPLNSSGELVIALPTAQLAPGRMVISYQNAQSEKTPYSLIVDVLP